MDVSAIIIKSSGYIILYKSHKNIIIPYVLKQKSEGKLGVYTCIGWYVSSVLYLGTWPCAIFRYILYKHENSLLSMHLKAIGYLPFIPPHHQCQPAVVAVSYVTILNAHSYLTVHWNSGCGTTYWQYVRLCYQ